MYAWFGEIETVFIIITDIQKMTRYEFELLMKLSKAMTKSILCGAPGWRKR